MRHITMDERVLSQIILKYVEFCDEKPEGWRAAQKLTESPPPDFEN